MIDRKFKILAVNPCNGKIYTEENAFLFTAKDKAFLPTLRSYLHACIDLGCDDAHLESIELTIKRVVEFQETECKKPDTDTPCEIDRCIGGIIK